MAEEKKILLDLQINYAVINKQLNDTKTKLQELTAEQKRLNAELKDASTANNVKEQERLQAALVRNKAEVKAYTQEEKNLEKQAVLMAQANKAEAGSYESLLRQQQLAQIQLKTLAGTLKQNADGTLILTEEYKKQAAQVRESKDALIQFDQGIKDGRTNVGNYAASFGEALEKTGLFQGKLGDFKSLFDQVRAGTLSARDGFNQFREGASKSVEIVNDWFTTTAAGSDAVTKTTASTTELGGALETTGAKGVTSMSALRAAVASTGVGLIVIALALVINYLRQLDPVVEKVEQLFGGLSATLFSLGSSIVDISKGLLTIGKGVIEVFTNPLNALNTFKEGLNGVADGYKNIAGNAINAASEGAKLVKAKQELEDRERALTAITATLNIESEKNRRLSEDRTKSAAERLTFLEKAQAAEKKLLLEERNVAADRLRAEEESVRLAGGREKALDDLLDKRQAAENALAKLNADLENKAAANAADSAKIRLAIQRDYIQGTIGLLNEQLRFEELNNRNTLELKKRILLETRNAELSATDLSAEQRLAIEQKYQNDLLALKLDTEKKKQDIIRQAQDISDQSILDGQQRELIIEARSLERKLDAIKGNSLEEQNLRAALREQSARNIIAIQQKYDQIELNEQIKGIDARAKIKRSEFTNEQRLREAQLKSQLAQGLISQQEFDRQTAELKANALAQELVLVEERNAAIVAKRNQFYLDEKAAIENSNLTKVEKGKELAKLLDEQRKENLKLDQDFQLEVAAINTDIAINTENQKLEASSKTTAGIRKNNELQRDAALSLLASTKDILAQDANIRKQYGAAIKTLALAEIAINLQRELAKINASSAANEDVTQTTRTLLTIAAVTRSVIGGIKVAATEFAVGGFTDVNGYRAQNIGSHASGGFRSRPTLGLIGEKGTEYVAPAWQINQYPELFNILEQNRIGYSAMPFANGGFTSTPIAIPLNQNRSVSFDYDRLSDILTQKLVQGISGVTIVADPREINDAIGKVNAIDARATI